MKKKEEEGKKQKKERYELEQLSRLAGACPTQRISPLFLPLQRSSS